MVYPRLSTNAGQVSKAEKQTEKGIRHLSPSYHTLKDTNSFEWFQALLSSLEAQSMSEPGGDGQLTFANP